MAGKHDIDTGLGAKVSVKTPICTITTNECCVRGAAIDAAKEMLISAYVKSLIQREHSGTSSGL